MENKTKSNDSCPFTPDIDPPNKTTFTNMLEAMDWFFDGWRNTAIVVSILSMLLVLSVVSTIPPLVAQSIPPSTWSDDLSIENNPVSFDFIDVPDSSADLIITEDLVLDGDQVLELVDTTYQINGDIYLRDNSKLILKNSSLILSINDRQKTGNPFSKTITVSNRSSLFLENSGIYSTGIMFYIIAEGQSDIRFASSKLGDGSLYLTESSTIIASGSSIIRLYYSGDTRGSITNSSLLHITNREYHRHYPYNYYKLEDTGELVFEDCKINYLLLRLAGSIEISEPVAGNHQEWSPHKDLAFDGRSFSITLKGSTILDSMHLAVINGTCMISDVQDELRLSLLNSVLSINNSSIFHVNADVSSRIDIQDSSMKGVFIGEDHSNENIPLDETNIICDVKRSKIGILVIKADCLLNFEETVLNIVDIDHNSKKITIKGGVTYGPWIDYGVPDEPRGRYPQFSFTQEYKVILQGEKHLIPDVPVYVSNSTGATIWSGYTSRTGEAYFNITYCNYYPRDRPYHFVTNYNDTWTLNVDNDGEIIETPIRFLESPSVIELSIAEPHILALLEFSTTSQVGLGAILLILLVKLLKGTII